MLRTFYPDCTSIVLKSNACKMFADVVLVLDSSTSVTTIDYEFLKTKLAEGIYNLVPRGANLGLVQYSYYQTTELSLDSNLDSDLWPEAILNMTQLTGLTLGTQALYYVINNVTVCDSWDT